MLVNRGRVIPTLDPSLDGSGATRRICKRRVSLSPTPIPPFPDLLKRAPCVPIDSSPLPHTSSSKMGDCAKLIIRWHTRKKTRLLWLLEKRADERPHGAAQSITENCRPKEKHAAAGVPRNKLPSPSRTGHLFLAISTLIFLAISTLRNPHF